VSLNVHNEYNLLKFLIMKNLQNLKGAKTLSKNEQQTINGGFPIGLGESKCPSNPRLCALPSGHCIPCHL
jgi:hypothetical protein